MSNSAFSKASQDNFNNLSVSVTGTSTRTLTIVQSNGNTISTTFSISELDPIFTAHTVYNISNGVGFLKNNNGVWSYDNSTYSLSTHNHELGSLLTTGITANLFPIANGTNGVSFTAIKTINGSSILGSGNITVGGGDVYKVGTPVLNQIGIWTGNGTIKGTSDLKFGESQVGLYIGDPDNFSRITLGNTHGYGNATITHTGTYIDYSFADTYSGILKIYNTGGIKIPLIPAKTSETNILYFNSADGTVSYGAAPTGGGMVYPSGTGITLVSGGNSWGTTITIPNNTTTFLRGDGTFASIVPQWTVDTYGIDYIGNVGIGVTSDQKFRLYVSGSQSSAYISKIDNTNANGSGLLVNTANNGNLGNILTLNAAGAKLYNFRGDAALEVAYNTAGTLTPSSGFGLLYAKNADGHIWWKNAAGNEWDLTLSGSGSGTPGGSSGSVQYNNGGVFGGFGNWNGSTLSVTGAVSATSNIISSAAVGTTGGGGSIGITGGYMYMPNMNAPSAPVSGVGYLYVAGTPGQEKIYFKNSTQAAYDLTLIGTGLTNPMTTKGDMIYGDTGGIATRIGIGTTGQFLTVSAGGIPAWTSYTYVLPLAADGTRGGIQISSTDGGLRMAGEFAVLDISRLNIVTPALEDYIAFNDVTDGSTRKATLSTIQALIGSGSGGGTVTSIASGNGMNFTTITTTGTVTMGTPSSISTSSTNGFPSSTTHTHTLDLSGRYVYSSGSITGGGNLSADRTFSLVNDSTSPGNSMYYGTNSIGTKGFYSLPSSSGMVYPSAGISISTGNAWNTSITIPNSTSMFLRGDGLFTVLPYNGTVTSFSAGNLSPLFTTSVSNYTTTPSLTFSATSQNANLVYASPNGSSGVPLFRQVVVADISATGTPNNTTFLRGDGSWSTPAGSTNYWTYSAPNLYPNNLSDNVLIGTTSNPGYNLYVKGREGIRWQSGTQSGYAFSVNSDCSGIATSIFQSTGAGGSGIFATGSNEGYGGVFEAVSATTNTSSVAIKITRTTTGTPANNLGSAIAFETNTSSGTSNVSEYARISMIATDITSGAGVGKLVFSLQNGASLNAFAEIIPCGTSTIGTALKLSPSNTAPNTPSEGMIYCGTDHHIYYYNGTTWKQLDN